MADLQNQTDVHISHVHLLAEGRRGCTLYPRDLGTDGDRGGAVFHRHDLWAAEDLQTIGVLQRSNQNSHRFTGSGQYQAAIAQRRTGATRTKAAQA